MYVAIYVLAIVFVIMFHEFGHFVTAKAFGMKAERFFLGFGPTLWSFQRGETEYGVKAIPAGGFVKITGMSRFEETDPADDGRLFWQQPAWKRVIVLVAGSATHFVVAAALLLGGFLFVGVQRDVATNVVATVEAGTPAAEAGLQPGDRIVAVGGEPTVDFEAARSLIEASGGERLPITVERDGTTITLEAAIAPINPRGEEVGFLGISPRPLIERLSLAEAVRETVSGDFSLPRLTELTLEGLTAALSPESLGRFFSSVGSGEPRSVADGGVSSLVGAGQLVEELGTSGEIFGVLTLLASLNIVLGTLNMLPLPPLDGGHVATLLVEESVNRVRRLRGQRERWHLDPSVVTPIALAVILFFGVLSLTAIYVDITNPMGDILR